MESSLTRLILVFYRTLVCIYRRPRWVKQHAEPAGAERVAQLAPRVPGFHREAAQTRDSANWRESKSGNKIIDLLPILEFPI